MNHSQSSYMRMNIHFHAGSSRLMAILDVSAYHIDRSPIGGDRRAAILDAFERCIVRAGFHRTTMQDVAKEASMSAGNLYRYFDSKDALVSGLCERDRERFGADFQHVADCLRRHGRARRARSQAFRRGGALPLHPVPGDLGGGDAQPGRRGRLLGRWTARSTSCSCASSMRPRRPGRCPPDIDSAALVHDVVGARRRPVHAPRARPDLRSRSRASGICSPS